MAIILIVDDELPITDLLAELIDVVGHTAITATNGRDALLLARKHLPALVISDMMMPIMDGYELVAALKADPLLAHTMIVLISAAINPARAPDGVTAFLTKPFSLTTIERLLDQLPL